MENDAEIFPIHYTWKVADKGFKMASMIKSCEIILDKQNYFFAKNHCEIQVRTILVCTLYSIKYGITLAPSFVKVIFCVRWIVLFNNEK